MRLRIRQLHMLIVISEVGNIRKSAEKLNLTQPAVTKALHETENFMEVELFVRSNRGVIPTSYGNILINHAKIVMSQLSHACNDLSDLQTGHGAKIVVGTLIVASSKLLPHAIQNVQKQYPDIRVHAIEGVNDKLIPALLNNDIDLVVGRLSDFRYRDNIICEALYKTNAVIVVGANHPLVARKNLHLNDLLEWRWILPPKGTTVRRQIDKSFFDVNLQPPDEAVESVSFLLNQRLLQNTELVGVMPYEVAQEIMVKDNIHILPVTLPETSGYVGFSVNRNRTLPAVVRIFINILMASASELHPSNDLQK